MNWRGRKVLVTGAGGFIGSHLAEELVRQGATTRALVRYVSDGNWGFLDETPLKADLEVVSGDITDRDLIHAAVRGMDVIFHLAALIAIPYSYRAPASYVATNIGGTLNVLQASHEQGVARLVHASTSEVYGTARYVPIDEAHPLQGQSPYSASKIGADKIAEAFHLSFGVPVVTIRPFNTYGPRQSARAVIPTIISQCLAGDVVRLGSLAPTRDFTYVADTVEGFLLAGSADTAVGETVNLGVGQEIAIGDLALTIAALMGKKIKIEPVDERVRPPDSEVAQLLSNNAKAERLLGWRPKVSLQEGLQKTIAWLSNNRQRVRAGSYVL